MRLSARPLPTALLGLVVAGVLAACTTASAGWTYAPAPSATPAPSGAASGAPSGSAAPSGGETGVIQISATGIKYDQTAVTVPASVSFQVNFKNNDAGTPHNISVHQGGPTGAELFKGEIFNGVGERTYTVPALDPGAYSFVCSVHPTMVVNVTAQ